jgi:hypothetical protein
VQLTHGGLVQLVSAQHLPTQFSSSQPARVGNEIRLGIEDRGRVDAEVILATEPSQPPPQGFLSEGVAFNQPFSCGRSGTAAWRGVTCAGGRAAGVDWLGLSGADALRPPDRLDRSACSASGNAVARRLSLGSRCSLG